ncbi:DUF1971 domain-containing protein [Escherichia coli O157]|nr:DUF1971 domain-containing protein [Escherichia coli O157]
MLQIPQNYIHTRSTPFWNKQTAPAGIFERHLDKQTAPAGIFERHLDKGTRPGVYPRLSVMHGAVKYLGYADEHSAEPDQVILIEAGQFAVFPPEKWHNIEAMTDDTYFNIDFFVAPEVLMEGAQQRKVIHNGK